MTYNAIFTKNRDVTVDKCLAKGWTQRNDWTVEDRTGGVWEVVGDGLQWSFLLRPKLTLHLHRCEGLTTKERYDIDNFIKTRMPEGVVVPWPKKPVMKLDRQRGPKPTKAQRTKVTF